jgi:hypothetical protein
VDIESFYWSSIMFRATDACLNTSDSESQIRA